MQVTYCFLCHMINVVPAHLQNYLQHCPYLFIGNYNHDSCELLTDKKTFTGFNSDSFEIVAQETNKRSNREETVFYILFRILLHVNLKMDELILQADVSLFQRKK